MHLRTANGELNLKLLHATPARSPAQPDLHVEVSATVQSFSVREARAWLEWPDVEAFLLELDAAARNVQGKANLYAMSPDDFALEVASLDSRGHFGVSFSIGTRLHTENGQFQCALRGGFEVELGQVEALLHWFRTVIGRTEA